MYMGPGELSRYTDLLRAVRSGDWIPVRPRFSALVQTEHGAHPDVYTVGVGSLSQEVKRPGRDVNHLPQSSAEVRERVELYLCSPSGPSWPVLGRTASALNFLQTEVLPSSKTDCIPWLSYYCQHILHVLLSEATVTKICLSVMSPY